MDLEKAWAAAGALALAVIAAWLGGAARLLHMWSVRSEAAEKEGTKARGVSAIESFAMTAASPVIAMISYGIGQYFAPPMDPFVIAAMSGFAGLAGPAAIIAVWGRVVDPIVSMVRPKGG